MFTLLPLTMVCVNVESFNPPAQKAQSHIHWNYILILIECFVLCEEDKFENDEHLTAFEVMVFCLRPSK